VQQTKIAGADGGVDAIAFYICLVTFLCFLWSFVLWVENLRFRVRLVQQTRAAGADGGVDSITFYMGLVTFLFIL